MKRFLALLMAMVMVFALVACGKETAENGTSDVSTTTTVPISSETTTTTTTTTETITDTTVTESTTTTTQHVHQYSVKKISPTCESKGYTQYICSCGHTYKDNYINAVGHNWKDATCTSEKTCETCGEISGEPLAHNYVNGVCTYCDCYDYVYAELAQDAFKYMEAKYGLTTYDVISMAGGEINGSPAVMFYYGYIKYFTYNQVTGRVDAWSVGNVEFIEYFRMDVKDALGE